MVPNMVIQKELSTCTVMRVMIKFMDMTAMISSTVMKVMTSCKYLEVTMKSMVVLETTLSK